MRVIYFAPVPWASYPQRPHFMARYFVERCRARVLWVNPYPTRLPRWGDLGRPPVGEAERSALHGLPLEVLHVRALPIEPVPGGPWLNRVALWRGTRAALAAFAAEDGAAVGVGRPSQLALWALRHLPASETFYDCMDDFPEFYAGWSRARLRRTEAAVAAAVGRILVSSEELGEKFSSRQANVTTVANACDMASLPPPADPARRPTGVVGYLGTIGRWFDWGLVLRLATALPTVRVRLVGPCFEPPPRPLPPNVERREACSREAALAELRDFDAGLIPFLDRALTRGVDPIKYYEYRAMGLPVLSTRFGSMARRAGEEGVQLVDRSTDWESALAAVLAFRPKADEVARFRAANDWSRRFDRVFPAGRPPHVEA